MRAARKAAPQESQAARLANKGRDLTDRRKAAEAFRTIAEVSDELGIAKHVLRFWELKFVQLRPMKRGGGRRFYRPDDIELLRGIHHLLQAEAFTIKGVQKILREQGADAVKRVGADDSTSQRSTRGSGRRARGSSGPAASIVDAAVTPQADTRLKAPQVVAVATAGYKSDRANVKNASALSEVVLAAIDELEAVRTMLSGGEAAATDKRATRTRS